MCHWVFSCIFKTGHEHCEISAKYKKQRLNSDDTWYDSSRKGWRGGIVPLEEMISQPTWDEERLRCSEARRGKRFESSDNKVRTDEAKRDEGVIQDWNIPRGLVVVEKGAQIWYWTCRIFSERSEMRWIWEGLAVLVLVLEIINLWRTYFRFTLSPLLVWSFWSFFSWWVMIF